MQLSKLFIISILSLAVTIGLHSCYNEVKADPPKSSAKNIPDSNLDKVWKNIEEIEQVQKNDSKMVLVDVYTDWCKWCIEMDKQTFSDPSLMQYLNENFHLVKFNAETKSNLNFKGKTYKFNQGGRRGHNQLAVELLGGKLSYPSFVVLDEDLNTIEIARGFKNGPQFKSFLQNLK